MNRHHRRRADARNPVMAAAYLRALASDLDRARDGLSTLAEIVETGRAAGQDVSDKASRLASTLR